MKVLPILLLLLAICSCSPNPAESGAEEQKQSVPTSPSSAAESVPPPAAPQPATVPQPAAPKSAAPRPANSASPSVSSSSVPSRPAEPASPNYNAPSAPAKKVQVVVVPAGTKLHVALSDPLHSGKNKVGDSFTAALAAPVYANTAVVLDRGTIVRGTVLAADASGRVSGKASMKVTLSAVSRSGDTVPIATKELAFEAESSTGRDAKVIGGGAGIGAIIGAIAGGAKGAATGAAIGGAAGTGTVLATRGKEVDLPVETKLTFTLADDLRVVLD